MKPTLAERFWPKVDKNGPNPHTLSLGRCWVWTASRSTTGYGRISREGRPTKAHRVSWEFAYGPVPDGSWVLHHCDNRLCVNPRHLYLGDHADNVRDAANRGRFVRGEAHGMARLTADDARKARALLVGGESQGAIARRLGVSRGCIQNIAQGHNWAWLDEVAA
jgi:hypothetical protein